MAKSAWKLKKREMAFISEDTLTSILATKTNTTIVNGELLHGNGKVKNSSHSICEDLKTVCKEGRLKEILDILHVMDRQGIQEDSCAYDSLLQGCLSRKALPEGKLVHAHIIQTGFKPGISLGTKLVIMYAKCGNLVDARRVLDGMSERNVVSWTAMIAAYARHGDNEEALTLFYQMQRRGIRPNQFTFASVLPACANLAALEHGMEVHGDIIRSGFQSNVFVATALAVMYGKCKSIESARQVFDKMPQRNVVSWNAMIAAYAHNGYVGEALKIFWKMPERNVVSWTAAIAGCARSGQFDEVLKLFQRMQLMGEKPNSDTFASVLPAYANLARLHEGKEVHEDIIRSGFQSNVFVGTALIDMYAKCRSIENARQVFDKMSERNVVSYNAMIAGYTQNGLVHEALNLFQKMPERNVISWTAVISGYVQNGHLNSALKLFRYMQLIGVKPDLDTFASALAACANLAALRKGKEAHENIIRNGFQSDIFVGNALVDMYAKCGSIEDACKVFRKMPRRDVVSWTSMIVGHAMHGRGKEALQIFQQMQHSGLKPDHVTFVGVLSACCQTGLVDDGCQYFDRMSRDYHIKPEVEHYCCMVDLLGRAGRLDEVQDFMNKIPINSGSAVWETLLVACRIHANTKLGECVAERLLALDPKNAAHYVLLANTYAVAGKWDDVEKVRKLMKARRVKKIPGCSWIEVGNKVHTFLIGDRSHPQTQKIYATLEKLSGQMKEAGYVPDTKFVLHDVTDQQKEHILCYHSERLAIAFGLINVSPGTPIRIFKNLRICGDCHSSTKFISKIVGREIVLRDANRFHHFKDGWCSCSDYW